MTWVRVDDKAWSHPKFATLSGNAARLWLFGLCWCNQQESDGLLPSSMLRMLRGSKKEADELVAAGLWEAVEGGWLFHDFLEYQPSKSQLAEQRNKTRERVTAHRERSRNGVTERERNTVTREPVTPLVTPPPSRPDPTRTEQPSVVPPVSPPRGDVPKPDVLRVFEAWKRETGHASAVLDPKRAKRIEARLRQGFSADQLEQAIANRKHDPFLMGQNDSGRVYDGIETLLRDAAQVERLLALKEPMRPVHQRAAAGGGSTLPLLMARIQRMEAEGEGN